MSRSKAILGVVLIFAFGIAVGFALSIRASVNRIREVAASTPIELGTLATHRLNRIVRFSPEQHAAALRILTEAESAIAAEQQKIAPEVEAITRRAQGEIRALLSREQQARFKTFPSPETSTPSRP